ncbi:hypothetical protein, partial [Paracoccus binzhouensis]|uniref:hypothetical protein n=1 Tax=Paracoccus binzhouensis TaxID=2796149 RepID=UPI001E2F2CFA
PHLRSFWKEKYIGDRQGNREGQEALRQNLVPGVYIPLGMPTMGGPLVTAGGLTFFHGSLDGIAKLGDCGRKGGRSVSTYAFISSA